MIGSHIRRAYRAKYRSLMVSLSRRALLQSSAALLVAGSLQGAAFSATKSTRVSRLNHNENPFGPSERARDALLDLGDDAWKYAYEEVRALRSLIAEYEGVRAGNIFVGEGSSEVLKLAAIAYGGPGRQVIAAHPTFTMLPQYAARCGSAVSWVSVDKAYAHDLGTMEAQIGNDTSLIYICNPNNPTGTLTDPGALRAFVQATSNRALTVVDEAYIDFVPDPESSMIDQVRSGFNVLVTRSFSKLYGLAGLRIGYGVGSEETIRRLESFRISIPNQGGVAAAAASLGDERFRSVARERLGKSSAFAAKLFDELRLHYISSQANFMMFDTGTEATKFVEFARQRGVLVAAVQDPFSSWVRVSMGRPEDMQHFARSLRGFLLRA